MHISAGLPALLNIDGKLIPENSAKIKERQIDDLALSLMNPIQAQMFEQDNSVNFTYILNSQDRLRITFYKQKGSTNGIFRTLSEHTLTIAELNLPDNINKILELKSGLVVIGGPAGSGKTSTLAAIVDLINAERSCHIITLEDPIEYFHSHKKSLVSQREIGQDTASFAFALRETLRQYLDVILVGEMRDLETISIAITAAETGHLVLATLHTTDAVQTIDRIIDVFPPHQQ